MSELTICKEQLLSGGARHDEAGGVGVGGRVLLDFVQLLRGAQPGAHVHNAQRPAHPPRARLVVPCSDISTH